MIEFPFGERLARLRLARSEGIGAVGFRQLVARWGSAQQVVAQFEAQNKPVCSLEQAKREMERAEDIGARHIFAGEGAYPVMLAQLTDPPPVLLVSGQIDLAHRPVIGMVGARNASAAGRVLATHIAHELGEAGFVVVSGLARGIDTAAHKGALGSGTIACIGCGIDVAYPPENATLQQEIAQTGLLLTELPPGTEPQARHFPRRNRLIAGLSQGLVVIEAAAGSGSLITARHAGEWGRDVFAVPGHPADPRSRGGNGLIREGAILVESAADIIEALSPFELQDRPEPVSFVRSGRQKKSEPAPSLFDQRAVSVRTAETVSPAVEQRDFVALLGVSGIGVDELVRASGLPASEVQARLTDLELDGRLLRLAGGRVALQA